MANKEVEKMAKRPAKAVNDQEFEAVRSSPDSWPLAVSYIGSLLYSAFSDYLLHSERKDQETIKQLTVENIQLKNGKAFK